MISKQVLYRCVTKKWFKNETRFSLPPVVSGLDGGGLRVEAVVGQRPHVVKRNVASVEADRLPAVVVVHDVAAALKTLVLLSGMNF